MRYVPGYSLNLVCFTAPYKWLFIVNFLIKCVCYQSSAWLRSEGVKLSTQALSLICAKTRSKNARPWLSSKPIGKHLIFSTDRCNVVICNIALGVHFMDYP